MNLYPDPLGTRFREVAARLFDVDADWVLPANGSDENLTLILRSFADASDLVAYPYPSYILYETLAQLQGCRCERIPLNGDWSWNTSRTSEVVERSKVVLVPNPNSPSGNRWSFDDLDRLVPPKGVLILDEAYGDFADEPHRGEFLRRAGERGPLSRGRSASPTVWPACDWALPSPIRT